MDKDKEQFLKVKGKMGTILVIEDENVLVEITQTSLEMNGYTVLTAYDGIEGLECFRKHINDIDLVVCDLNMPHLDGNSALHVISSVKPEIKIVIVSGSVEAHHIPSFSAPTEFIFLQKPYRSEKLIRAVEQLLLSGVFERKAVGM
jgi:two-component system, cell cycle sensor histidine kinase and response regulator CckA